MESKDKVIHVVADAFSSFACHEDVVTVSALVRELRVGRLDGCEVTLVRGQGIDGSAWSAIEREIRSRSVRMSPAAPVGPASPVASHVVHKRRPENVMIGDLVRLGPSRYGARLVLDRECEMLRDHLTGQHIQGLTLVEAGRQMMLAVTEAFLVPGGGAGQGFVLNTLSTEFLHYLFPMEACIDMVVDSLEHLRGRRTAVGTTVTIAQAGVTAARITADYVLVPEASLHRQEAVLARQAVVALTSSATPAPVLVPTA